MLSCRRFSLVLLIAVAAVGLAGCEPYISMTDQIPAQTRRAATLLPETPRYVGMVDVETALRNLEDLRGGNLTDSLRQADDPRLRAFLDATGIDPKTDVQAAYGALAGKKTVSGVLFANVTPQQMDRYLEAASGESGRSTTYRDVPLYHLWFGTETADPADTLTVAFVEKGMMAVGTNADRVTAMVDRHRSTEQAGLGTNEAYMTLVKRVGHGSTAWLVGRDVVETAIQDSAPAGSESESGSAPRMNRAGLQHALTQWTDRMLGLSKVDVSSFEGQAGKKVNQLKRKLREQAVSITLTDAALRGEVYLTMRDNASASSVVDVAEGAVAVAKLSNEELDDRHRDLLDEIQIERNGAIVHIEFSLERDRLRKRMEGERRAAVTRPGDPSIRPFTFPARRLGSIKPSLGAFERAPMIGATNPELGLSTPTPPTS